MANDTNLQDGRYCNECAARERELAQLRGQQIDVDELKKTIKTRLQRRVGYVESDHKEEVMKGALMALNIVKEMTSG
jgi:Tfp pilus assembly protein PilN